MSGAVLLRVGARFMFDGEVVEVAALDGLRLTVKDARDRWQSISVVRFLASAACVPDAGHVSVQPEAVAPGLAALDTAGRAEVAERAAHVREVLTGYRSGSDDLARVGEPRAEFDPRRPQQDRERAKAAELGVADRTIRRWLRAYRENGDAGLVDTRRISGRTSTIDPRWVDACLAVLAERVNESTPTGSAVLRLVDERLDEQFGPGVVLRPSTSTAYRQLAALTKGSNALSGSSKGRRSIADRPKGTYGRLRATRPGEFVVLDTQDLDVFAMEPVTCRWVRAQLTVAQDLFTRCILGLRVTAVSTKAVDVAGVLFQVAAPQEAPADWPDEACWPYHGIPQQLVFSEDARLAGRPVCAPETLVVDHGKAFLSSHVLSVCTRLGISIQPAQPKKPTDKPTVERFFKTLREGLIQHLPAYKGPDVYSRGERIEDAAFLYLHELEDVIRQWVALVYHRTRHEGLCVPEWPRLGLSPNEMYEIGVAKAGLLRIPASPDLILDFLDVEYRTIQHYGVEVHGLRYNGPGLDPYRDAVSPYGGRYAGKWPIRVNPVDLRFAWFQDPADRSWHRLDWEHAPGLDAPFSQDAAQHARRLAVRHDRWPDERGALRELLDRWRRGAVTDRRERRMAIQMSAEHAALPGPQAAPLLASGETAQRQEVSAMNRPELCEKPVESADRVGFVGDDDAEDELLAELDLDEFYADAFEVIE